MEINLSSKQFSIAIKGDEIRDKELMQICIVSYPINEDGTEPFEFLDGVRWIGDLNLNARFNGEQYKMEEIDLSVRNAAAKRESVTDNGDVNIRPCLLDRNGDGVVTKQDIDQIYDFTKEIPLRFDLNNDGYVTEADRQIALQYEGHICSEGGDGVTFPNQLVKSGCWLRILPESYDGEYYVTNDVINSTTGEIVSPSGHNVFLRNLANEFHPALVDIPISESLFSDEPLGTTIIFRCLNTDRISDSGFYFANTDVDGDGKLSNDFRHMLYLGGDTNSGTNPTENEKRYNDSFRWAPLGPGYDYAPPTSLFQGQRLSVKKLTKDVDGVDALGVNKELCLEFYFKPIDLFDVGAGVVDFYSLPHNGTGVYPMNIQRVRGSSEYRFRVNVPEKNYPEYGHRGALDFIVNGISYDNYLYTEGLLPFDYTQMTIPNMEADGIRFKNFDASMNYNVNEWNYMCVWVTQHQMGININGSISTIEWNKVFDIQAYDRFYDYWILACRGTTPLLGYFYPYNSTLKTSTNAFQVASGVSDHFKLYGMSAYERKLSSEEMTQNMNAYQSLNLD